MAYCQLQLPMKPLVMYGDISCRMNMVFQHSIAWCNWNRPVTHQNPDYDGRTQQVCEWVLSNTLVVISFSFNWRLFLAPNPQCQICFANDFRPRHCHNHYLGSSPSLFFATIVIIHQTSNVLNRGSSTTWQRMRQAYLTFITCDSITYAIVEYFITVTIKIKHLADSTAVTQASLLLPDNAPSISPVRSAISAVRSL